MKDEGGDRRGKPDCLGLCGPLQKERATHSNILAWKSPGQRSLVGYSPRGHKELDTTE